MTAKYHTVFTDQAKRQLRVIERDFALAVLHKLTQLSDDPYGYGTTELVDANGKRRLPVGNYRVIHTVDNDQLLVEVVKVGHRSRVYD